MPRSCAWPRESSLVSASSGVAGKAGHGRAELNSNLGIDVGVGPPMPGHSVQGVGAGIYLLKPVKRHVGVALGRGQARVAKKLLDSTQISARVEQVRGAAVAQGVRM